MAGAARRSFGRYVSGTTLFGALCISAASRAAGPDERGIDLVAVARAGARPKECGGATRARANRWERAKAPGLEQYCDVLARGYGKLATAPADALALSAEAARLMPSEAAPLVLAGRAKVAVGAFAEAYAALERAMTASRASLEAPGALHDFAVAAEQTGHPREALEAYRALAPRAELFDDPDEALRVFIEGAFVAMEQGPDRLTEAVGYLNEARRMPKVPELESYLLAALSLALDRQGRHNEAAGIAAEAAGPWQLEDERVHGAKLGRRRPILPDGELIAMVAVLAERRDRELSLERWQSFLDSPAGKSGPFAAHARARRDALKRKPHG
jgi:tetratricopeptide (TPR) repeat protein